MVADGAIGHIDLDFCRDRVRRPHNLDGECGHANLVNDIFDFLKAVRVRTATKHCKCGTATWAERCWQDCHVALDRKGLRTYKIT